MYELDVRRARQSAGDGFGSGGIGDAVPVAVNESDSSASEIEVGVLRIEIPVQSHNGDDAGKDTRQQRGPSAE